MQVNTTEGTIDITDPLIGKIVYRFVEQGQSFRSAGTFLVSLMEELCAKTIDDIELGKEVRRIFSEKQPQIKQS